MIKKVYLKICVFTFFVIIASFAQAKPLSSYSKNNELNQVNQQIQGLKNTLTAAQQQQSNLQQQLKKLETHLGSLSDHLHKTHQALGTQQAKLDVLVNQQLQYQQQLQAQQIVLAEQLRAAYLLGNNEYSKMLFNQENPNDLERMMIYSQSLTKARTQAIEQIQNTLNKAKQTQLAIQQETRALTTLQTQEQNEQQSLEGNRQQRQQVLQNVNSNIQTKNQQLQKLLSDKLALQSLLKRLRLQASVVQQPKVPFASMQRKLIWPVKGPITARFGSHLFGTKITLPAIEIAAPMGSPIHAVYPGKVVFANWLRGIGLLIIVDHDNRFMTLYGHAQSLYKKVGDTVVTGDVIASIGDSGGIQNSGLYFQIREGGQPVDPQQWLK